MADPLTWMAALSAEGMRKSHVARKIGEKRQEEAARKAEKRSKEQEAKNLAIRQEEARQAKMIQRETVVKKPKFKPKGGLRSQFTINGDSGSDSGVNY